ncbi:hypothetical protein [Bifidobacterium sp.]|jgi:hypothetical protein|uniref:hypothetical protein n=1 Tax=Bifidobacterium sp. TaxID=41200 RepID=UPI0025C6EC0E|nr:hypothetical protein [Bifidobacterium sp.]MCH4209635.1 hypothetical protein [Bifidobacterium sp.]MCI1224838.1 hypothetical protein [Bifidobacterium sp.]
MITINRYTSHVRNVKTQSFIFTPARSEAAALDAIARSRSGEYGAHKPAGRPERLAPSAHKPEKHQGDGRIKDSIAEIVPDAAAALRYSWFWQ